MNETLRQLNSTQIRESVSCCNNECTASGSREQTNVEYLVAIATCLWIGSQLSCFRHLNRLNVGQIYGDAHDYRKALRSCGACLVHCKATSKTAQFKSFLE